LFFFIATAIIIGVAAYAAAAGSGDSGSLIIPAEGLLFMPNAWATRATVALALYNVAEDKALEDSTQGGLGRSFSDIPKSSEYYAQVDYCAAKGYISGYPDGTFKPEGIVTRAEMCAILFRFLALAPDSSAPLPPDVPSEHWAADYISAVISSGIMSGYQDKTFKMGNTLTRAELATIIVNAAKLKLPSVIPEFVDVPENHWAYAYVSYVSAPLVRDPSPYEIEVAELINARRASAGVAALALDPFLCEIARIKAQDMVDNDYFDHKSPTWGWPEDIMITFGVAFNLSGENIACGASTPEAVVAAWVDSPAHHNNMLRKDYYKTGVGCVTRKDGTVFWVQAFIG